MSQDRSERKGSQIVHVRENSDSDLEALFSYAINPSSDTNKSIPLRMRNLPASFFQPPEPHLQTGKEGSAESTGYSASNTTSTPNFSIAHTRVRSSPASLSQTQTLSTAPPPPCSQHVRQHSYDLAEEPLPPGWSIGVTVVGQRYFLNHETQTTTWQDPRKTQSTTNLLNPQQQQPAPAQQQQHAMQQQQAAGGSSNQPPQIINVDKIPLPPGWERAFTNEGECYYIHHVERTTSWFHPSVPAHLQRPTMRLQQTVQQQQQQQPMQVNSPASSPNVAQCQVNNADRHRQLQLQQLKIERERLKKREEELARQELMLRTGNIQPNDTGGDIVISQASEMTSVTDPFLSQSGTSDHTRQESSDSGLGGMGTSYSLSRTPDDFLGNMEEMDSQDGGPKMQGQSEFGNMDISNVGSGDGGDSNMESEDLVPSLNEAISNDLLKDVENVLQSNKMDNLLTWL
ncbi:transcriptional coactivator YAP1 isoform X2 [Patella vulgata]|uniref:transcriptional coactivator YAP1 isoform X2 n=1 Tax=Patella vulgata TaxID=6465 RepID=UPI00217FEFFC|nr:transcriptional coactivator YAP1 isoform X2 [Patella vulgata]